MLLDASSHRFLARPRGRTAPPVIARRYEPPPSALRRLPACLYLRGERGDLRVREAERGARLFRRLGGERLDPAVHHALVIGRRAGSASEAASAARASASMSTTSARRFSSAV